MVLDSIRKFSGRKRLKKIKSSIPKPVAFNKIKTIGILYYLDDDSNLKHLKKILQQPFLQDKIVTTICWLKSSKKKPHPQMEGVSFVERVDFDSKYLPSSKTVRYFGDQDFDLLMDLSSDYHFPIHAMAVMSNAKLKAGRENKLNWHLQLKIQLSDSKSRQTLYLYEQVIFYLEQLLK